MTEKSASDVLREKLKERGVEWKAGLDGVTFIGDWCFVEYENGSLAATCEPVLTPEQAVAATLGSDRENELRVALNKAAGNWAKADRLARDIWEQVSHCPDYPIPPCMTESICEQFRNLSDVEQAATLGSGECEQVLTDCNDGLMPPFTAHCSKCDEEWAFTPKYCYNCGAKVTGTRDERKAVKR